MKRLLFFTAIILGTVTGGFAQAEASNLARNFSFGFAVGQAQHNFGIGLNFTSPYFANGSFAIRGRGNLMWNEVVLNGKTTWSPYGSASIGMVGVAGEIGDFMRIYGEGGVTFIFPNSDFSSDNFVNGGYGLFGFEFFFEHHFNYFIEIGGVGTGATADKVFTQPIYNNGLLINAGFRVQF